MWRWQWEALVIRSWIITSRLLCEIVQTVWKELYKLCIRSCTTVWIMTSRLFCGIVRTVNCADYYEPRHRPASSVELYKPYGIVRTRSKAGLMMIMSQEAPASIWSTPPWPLFKVNYCFPEWITLHILALGLFSLFCNAVLIFVILET